ncbi:MAG: SDR family NAD(P)-dependent oxidoreductase [Bacillota bacterium]
MKTKKLDRTALITGANNGIGLELTRKMLDEGWQIIALVRSEFSEEDKLIQKSLKTGQLRMYLRQFSYITSSSMSQKCVYR